MCLGSLGNLDNHTTHTASWHSFKNTNIASMKTLICRSSQSLLDTSSSWCSIFMSWVRFHFSCIAMIIYLYICVWLIFWTYLQRFGGPELVERFQRDKVFPYPIRIVPSGKRCFWVKIDHKISKRIIGQHFVAKVSTEQGRRIYDRCVWRSPVLWWWWNPTKTQKFPGSIADEEVEVIYRYSPAFFTFFFI